MLLLFPETLPTALSWTVLKNCGDIRVFYTSKCESSAVTTHTAKHHRERSSFLPSEVAVGSHTCGPARNVEMMHRSRPCMIPRTSTHIEERAAPTPQSTASNSKVHLQQPPAYSRLHDLPCLHVPKHQLALDPRVTEHSKPGKPQADALLDPGQANALGLATAAPHSVVSHFSKEGFGVLKQML